MLKQIGRYRDGRVIYRVEGSVPSIGYIAFGVIDRGTNVIQVRPTTICPQACIFCSVDAGLVSSNRWAEYIVEPNIVLKGVQEVASVKDCGIEALIDTIGDPLTYPWLVELVRMLRGFNYVKSIALETHGLLLNKRVVDELNEAGLSRVNLSLETLSYEKAKILYGTPAYDLRRVIETAEYLVRETDIDLHVTILWLPGVNDDDLIDVVNWAYRIGAGKKWPPVTIQKYIKHRYGRRTRIPEISWSRFWRFVERLESQLGVRLRWDMSEWGMHYARKIPTLLKPGDLVVVNIMARGWLKGEYLGSYDDKVLISVIPSKATRVNIGGKYLVRVKSNKDSIYIGEIFDQAS